MLLYVRQLVLGLGVTDLNRPVFWGAYLVNFIFLIGISMAGTVISAVLQLLKVNWRRPITRIAESLTVFGLMTAGLQIIMDMGRPDRLAYTLIYGRLQAPLLWDIASLTLYLLTAIFALYLQLIPDIALLRDTIPATAPLWRKKLYEILALGWTGAKEQWRRLEKAITVVSVFIIPIGISLHTVTSWLFSTTVQPGWKSTILGPYFVVGAIFSGIGLLFIATTFAREYNKHLKAYITETFYTNLGWIFIVMSAVWFYFTLNETLVVVTEQETLEFPVMASKLFGQFAPAFWGMNILMIAATWILVAPKFISDKPSRNPLFQTVTGLGATAV
ncbi:polysulfide reductase NrfD, partial [bacterium]|nr:polysulfide reductase NrfD [bacterium]